MKLRDELPPLIKKIQEIESNVMIYARNLRKDFSEPSLPPSDSTPKIFPFHNFEVRLAWDVLLYLTETKQIIQWYGPPYNATDKHITTLATRALRKAIPEIVELYKP